MTLYITTIQYCTAVFFILSYIALLFFYISIFFIQSSLTVTYVNNMVQVTLPTISHPFPPSFSHLHLLYLCDTLSHHNTVLYNSHTMHFNTVYCYCTVSFFILIVQSIYIYFTVTSCNMVIFCTVLLCYFLYVYIFIQSSFTVAYGNNMVHLALHLLW